MKIAVPPFPSLRGSVVAPPDSEWSGQFIFSVRSSTSPGLYRDFTVNSAAFSMDDLPPGKWVFQLDSNISRLRDSHKLFIRSATYGLQDAISGPITVTESGNPPFEIRITPDPARFVATVVDQNGTPRPGISVILFPGLPGAYMPTRSSGQTKEDGTLSLDDLAPLRYRVIALNPDRPTSSSPVDELNVDLKPGETSYVRITVPKP